MDIRMKFSGGKFSSGTHYETTDSSFSRGYGGGGVPALKQDKVVVPSDTEQVVTADIGRSLGKVVVKRIPKEYRHIRYNGSVLTVY